MCEYKILSGIITRLIFLSLSQVIMMNLALVVSILQKYGKIIYNQGEPVLLWSLQNILSLLIFLRVLMFLWGSCGLMVFYSCRVQW